MSEFIALVKIIKPVSMNEYMASVLNDQRLLEGVEAEVHKRAQLARRSISPSVLVGMLEENLGDIENQEELVGYLTDWDRYDAAASRHTKIADGIAALK